MNRDPIGERGGINLFCGMQNRPTTLVDGRGDFSLQVGLALVGGGIAVYGLSLGLIHTWRDAVIDAKGGAHCCQLKRLAEDRGVMLDRNGLLTWPWWKRYIYCRHCLDCNTLSTLKRKAPLLKNLVTLPPNTSFTGVVVTDTTDFAALTVQKTAEAAGDVLVGDEITESGGTVTYRVVDPASVPCQLSVCVGFKP